MNWQEIETWLKTTIPGIVILGAVGSVIAVWLCHIFGDPLLRLLRWPFDYWLTKRSYQAYLLGYSHGAIKSDKSGVLLITFLVYHLAKMLVAFFLGFAGWVMFLQFAYTSSRPLLTLPSLMGVILMFLSGYRAYFEFEFIRRTFLWQWGNLLKGAESCFGDYRKNPGLKVAGNIKNANDGK